MKGKRGKDIGKPLGTAWPMSYGSIETPQEKEGEYRGRKATWWFGGWLEEEFQMSKSCLMSEFFWGLKGGNQGKRRGGSKSAGGHKRVTITQDLEV